MASSGFWLGMVFLVLAETWTADSRVDVAWVNGRVRPMRESGEERYGS